MTVTQMQIHTRGSTDYWDCRTLLKSAPTYTTDPDFAAGTLTFDLIEVNEGFTPKNGDEVRFSWDGHKVFFGYIFTVNYSSDEVFSCTAYDKLRYLKNEDSVVWPVSSIGQRFTTACKASGISYKVIYDPGYRLPTKVSDGVSYFSMLQEDIETTAIEFGQACFIRDNYGTVELCAYPMPVSGEVMIVGDSGMATSWAYDRSIDEAANVVRVEKNSQADSGKIGASETATGNTISRWGKLQKVEKLSDDKMNSAQMKAKAKALLKVSNVEKRTLKVSAIGNLGFYTGGSFVLKVQSLIEIGISARRVTIGKCTQNFDPDHWTTEMEVSW